MGGDGYLVKDERLIRLEQEQKSDMLSYSEQQALIGELAKKHQISKAIEEYKKLRLDLLVSHQTSSFAGVRLTIFCSGITAGKTATAGGGRTALGVSRGGSAGGREEAELDKTSNRIWFSMGRGPSGMEAWERAGGDKTGTEGSILE